MTTLPDLDPNTAGHVAFYNAASQTPLETESMTWSDVLDNPAVNSHTPFDNGIIIQYADSAWDDITIRVKTDGWVVAYTGWDGEENGAYGPTAHNLMTPMSADGSDSTVNPPDGLTKNRLAKSIKDMVTDLSDWSSLGVSFDMSDVGLYEFNYVSKAISYFNQFEASGSTFSREVSKAAGTTTDHAVAAGYSQATGSGEGEVVVDGNVLIDNNGNSTIRESTDVTLPLEQTGSSSAYTSTSNLLSQGITYIIHWSDS